MRKKIATLLPSKTSYHYQEIIYRIKAEIVKSIKELKDYLHDEKCSKDEVHELKGEIRALFAKMTIIDEELKREEVQLESEETQKENTLVFVPTPSGEIRVISDIEHIDQEYYEKFLGLFLSIKDGSFKNVKRFAPNSKWSRICEVKDFKVRVCFKRLTDDTYAVITAFTKKSNNEKYYQSSLTQKFDDFEKMEQGIRDSLTNEEFMAEQAKYEAELFRILMGNKKDKAPVLMKGAE